MLSPSQNFFQTKRSLAEIKAELLPAYFRIWVEETASEEILLIDLNTGNGYEADGNKAAALQVSEIFEEPEKATENEAKTLSLFLSDPSKTNLEKLKLSLQNPEEEEWRLPENIHFLNEPETLETLVDLLQKVPGLLSVNPFSYRLAEEVVAEAIAKKHADLFLLFDYKKLENSFLSENPGVCMEALFGEEFPAIKAKLQLQKSPKLKAQFLTEQLEKAFRQRNFYPVTFKINAPGRAINAAYLFLATKTKTTYFQTKEWLATFSEKQEDGVPLLGINLNYQPSSIPGFSDFLNKFSLENLTRELAISKSDFHYQTIREVYETHSLTKPYILANYLAAFQQLQAAGKVNLVDVNNKKAAKVTPEALVFYRLHTAEPKPVKRLR